MGINDELKNAVDTLEALYYVAQGLTREPGDHISKLRALCAELPRRERHELLALIRKDIDAVRSHFGALAPNKIYKTILADGRKAPTGQMYINKLRIRRELFSRYDRSIVRWPHIKDHAFVVFEPQTGRRNEIFELDGQLFHDAQFLLQKARHAQGDATKQRYLPYARHRILHSLLRQTVMALFTFLEAYLNGIAFDCFQEHHATLAVADHDLLAEWDSAKTRRRFVAFDQKVFRYPVVVAQTRERQIDLSGFTPAHEIVRNGKEVRDAITHPSAQFDPVSREQKKVTLIAGLDLSLVDSLYADVCEYVRFVEEGIGNEVKESAFWLFDDHGFALAKRETV